MDSTLFHDLEATLSKQGAAAAVQRLCDSLRASKDYHSLFYALLLKKRHEMGVNPLPTGPAADLPPAQHAEYEDAIRQAGREIGGLFLQDDNINAAWAYFRMIGEPGPVRTALEKHEPKEDEDLQALVQIAFYEGVHPNKGFDWILSRFGLCSAITTLGSQELPAEATVRQHCIGRLVRALVAELRDRLLGEIERHDGSLPSPHPQPLSPEGRGETVVPLSPQGRGVGGEGTADEPGVVRKLMAGRDWLFADDCYHIDTSHLSSVVQMSLHLLPGVEMDLARELCEYGSKLSNRFTTPGDPPFENLYQAHGIYLAILAGDHVEENLNYFREQAANADPETVGTFPAEVLVNLLLRLKREPEALAVARKYLARVDNRRLTCPSLSELCQRVGDYRTLAEAAREQGDAVHFMAGLLAAGK
jgi:hypothetical protein